MNRLNENDEVYIPKEGFRSTWQRQLDEIKHYELIWQKRVRHALDKLEDSIIEKGEPR